MIDDIDFEGDELLYERMMNMSKYYNLNEYKTSKKSSTNRNTKANNK